MQLMQQTSLWDFLYYQSDVPPLRKYQGPGPGYCETECTEVHFRIPIGKEEDERLK